MRHCEQFTALHLGLLAETRRKSLPRWGKTVHVDPQAFQHFLAHADWSVEALRRQRLEVLRQAVGTTPFVLCRDETGDRKKGDTTDYAASQYIGNRHTLANGVAIAADEKEDGAYKFGNGTFNTGNHRIGKYAFNAPDEEIPGRTALAAGLRRGADPADREGRAPAEVQDARLQPL